jgi:hypothetical protein
MTLAEALAQVHLEPGKTCQVQVKPNGVQVRVQAADEFALAKPFDEADVIVDMPLDFSMLGECRFVRVVRAPERWPYERPIEITEDDLAPGDLP